MVPPCTPPSLFCSLERCERSHNFILGNGLVFGKYMRSRPGCLPLDYRNFHVLDLYANQQEIDFANYHILQMIF